MKRFIVKTNKKTYDFDCLDNQTNEDVKKLFKKQYSKEKIITIVDTTKQHFCKYCGRVAEGNYEDLLCSECRIDFGHSLYSEL